MGGIMSGQGLRQRFVRRFVGLSRYSRVTAWLVVCAFIVQALAVVWLGSYLLSLDLSVGTVLLMILTALFIGTRLRGLNNIVQECTHSSFAEDREDNTRIGRFCSAILTGCYREYKADHLSHHAHLGDYEHDRELGAIQQFGLHEPLTPRTIFRHFITPLTGRHLREYSGINMSRDDGLLFYGLKMGVLVLIAFFAILAPVTTLLFVVLPLFFVFPTLNFWTDCLDHAGLVGKEDELEASRNVLAPSLVRFIFFPRHDCYHMEHHLFPQIPARHHREAHEELCNDPEYGNQPLASWPTHKGLGTQLAHAVAPNRGIRADGLKTR